MRDGRASRVTVLLLVLVGSIGCQVYEPDLLRPAPRKPDKRDAGPDSSAGAAGRDAEVARAANGGGDAGRRDQVGVAMDAATERDATQPRVESGGSGGGAAPPVDSGKPDRVDAALTDECPGDTNKTVPGVCGCGVAENCSGLRSALVHRYRFEGVGPMLLDSRSAANGTTGSPLTDSSALSLSGASGSYATLPSGLLSTLAATTVEFWLNWQGGSARQRAVSFGTALPNRPNATCTGNADYFSGSWYHFCQKDGTMTWSKARGVCEAAAGFLVAIESAAEDGFLGSHPAFTESVWIGANDVQVDGQWYFANQGSLQGGTHFWSGDERGSALAGAYENWRRDQPNPADNDPNVDCAFIFKPTATWTAYACEYDGNFVCEWRGHRGSSMNRGVSFTPADDMGRPALSLQPGMSAVVVARGTNAFPLGKQTHVALVLDPAGGKIALYIDAALAASVAASFSLAEVRDIDNWLGRSHLAADPGMSGSISELRIYDRALTSEEIVTSKHAGTDPLFLE